MGRSHVSDIQKNMSKIVLAPPGPPTPAQTRAPIICIFREEYGYVKVKVSSFVSNIIRIRFPPTMLLHKTGVVFLSVMLPELDFLRQVKYYTLKLCSANSQGWPGRRASSNKGYSIDAPISKVVLLVMVVMMMMNHGASSMSTKSTSLETY